MNNLKLVVLNSCDKPSSFNALAEALVKKEINADFNLIIVSKPTGYDYVRNLLENLGIDKMPEIIVIDRKKYENIDKFNDEIHRILLKYNFGLIVMSGWLHLFRVGEKYKYKVINLHPALFRTGIKGKGAYGKNVHSAIIEKKLPAGCTVHFADDEYDHGPIILEKEIKVLPTDTPETISLRVRNECVRDILPRAIQLIAEGKIKIENNKVKIVK
ncbi:MAG: hypothetical protein US76_03825 [Parcubacteria group bacterium GW2011_GWA2_38_13b]|nr:MAG: hypothetical protein US76_03825 [Parcubacteria group bacterium GW2011_GWA2_38_13b]